MNIDTAVIQRVRDALLSEERLNNGPAGTAQDGNELGFQQETLQRFSPFAETMFLVAIADGHEDPKELDALSGAMRLLTDNGLADSVLQDIYQRCKHDASELGVDRYLERIGARLGSDRMDRETAFTLAAAVALADGRVEIAESDLLRTVAEYFGISNKAMRRLLEEI